MYLVGLTPISLARISVHLSRAGAIAGALLAGTVASHAFQNEGTVRVGLIESLTTQYATYGLPGLWGSQIAIDEINAAGGVKVDGKQVKIAVTPAPDGVDPAGDIPATLGLIKKLQQEHQVLLIKGLSYSSAAEASFNFLNELERQGAPITLHSSAVASPGLGKISKWGFRNVFIETEAIPAEIRELKTKLGISRAGIFILRNNVYGPTLFKEVIEPALKANGIEVVAVTDTMAEDKDFSRQVDAIKDAKADVVFAVGNGLPIVGFMKEANRRGLTPKIFVGGVSQLVPDFAKVAGAENMVVAGPFDPDSKPILAFAEKYKARFKQEMTTLAVSGYDAMYLIKEAIEKSGIKNTPESLSQDRIKFRDALESAKAVGITGEPIAFNADHDTLKKGVILTFRDGRLVLWDGKPAK